MIFKAARSLSRRFLEAPPRGMRCGKGVSIQRPNRISHAECIEVGDRTRIGRGALFAPISEYAGVRYSPKIEIGNDVYIGPNVYVACTGSICIGDYSVLSEYVYLNDTNHGLDPLAGPIMEQKLESPGNITIGRGCFIGFRSAILPGVVLGDHCVVGVNAVVTKSFPAYSMIAGVPAVRIKSYSMTERKWIQIERDSTYRPR